MKRLKLTVLLLCLVLTAMFAFSACGGSGEEEAAEPQTKVMSDEDIVGIAFDDAGIEPVAAQDITISADDGSGIKRVSFIIEDAEYSYSIDVSTGKILDSAKPDTVPDVDPTEAAMRMVEQLPEFKDASNINAVQNGDKVTVTFESGGKSYKWIYDPAYHSLTRQ